MENVRPKYGQVMLEWDRAAMGDPTRAAVEYGLKVQIMPEPRWARKSDDPPVPRAMFFGDAMKVFKLALAYAGDIRRAAYLILDTPE